MENIIEDAWGAEYANGIIPFFHKDSNGNIVSKEVTGGTYTIKNGVIVLEEYPDLQYGLTISLLNEDGTKSETLSRVEKSYSALNKNEYIVDIVTGFIHFHSSLEGSQVKVDDYFGKGQWLITDKRIIADIVKDSNGNYDYKTLAETIASAKGFISKGEWNRETAYDMNNIVVYNGVIYISKQTDEKNKGKEPGEDSDYWDVVIDVNSIIQKEVSPVQSQLNSHISNTSNPHKVTKSQVGLENVPNVTTNNQTPTYTEATTLTNITSGETLSTAFGKIKKAIANYIIHRERIPEDGHRGHVYLSDRPTYDGLSDNSTAASAYCANLIHQNIENHKVNTDNPHAVTKAQVGLGNVDNTSDLNKPISTAMQKALNGKQSTITGGATTITSSNLTANRALISDSNGKVAVSDITNTELGYLDGATSNIQTQLNTINKSRVKTYTNTDINSITNSGIYNLIYDDGNLLEYNLSYQIVNMPSTVDVYGEEFTLKLIVNTVRYESAEVDYDGLPFIPYEEYCCQMISTAKGLFYRNGYKKVRFPEESGMPFSFDEWKDFSTESVDVANKYTDAKIADLINGAPTTLDTLKEIADVITENKSVVEALDSAIGNKVDKVSGKGLSTNDYTTTEKNKLAGIESNANNYSHPTYTAKSSGLYKVTVDSTGHVSGATAVTKSDITALGIPSSDTNTTTTTGASNTSSKIYLVGATSQSSAPTTYSHDTVYVGTDGHLYSNSKQAVNLSDSQALTNKTYNGYTLGSACSKGVSTTPTSGSTNLITSGAVYDALNNRLYHTSITTATDFNTLQTTGIYHIAVANCTNTPVYDWGTLYVDFSVGTPYQIYIPDGSIPVIYKRGYSNSSWTKWKPISNSNTLVFAANDSCNDDKNRADIVLSGSDDRAEIMAAINALSTNRNCEAHFCAGTYNLKVNSVWDGVTWGSSGKYIGIYAGSGNRITKISGAGRNTVFNISSDITNQPIYGIYTNYGVIVENLQLKTNVLSGVSSICLLDLEDYSKGRDIFFNVSCASNVAKYFILGGSCSLCDSINLSASDSSCPVNRPTGYLYYRSTLNNFTSLDLPANVQCSDKYSKVTNCSNIKITVSSSVIGCVVTNNTQSTTNSVSGNIIVNNL